MSEVKRFRADHRHVVETEFDDAQYVSVADYDALQQRLADAEKRAAIMEKALTRIAREHDCGCWPCTGSCVSQTALEITVEAMRDIAAVALKPEVEGEGS